MQQKPRNLGRPRHDQTTKPTKSVILETATTLFLQNGYKIVSMDDVAKACNVTKATIYYYYSTKADLYTDCMIVMMVRISENISKVLANEQPLKIRLYQLIKIHLSATEDIDLNNFMRDAKINLSKEQQEQMKQSEEKMHEAIQHVLVEAMEKGEIPHHDSKFVTQLFLSLLNVGNYRDASGQAIFSSIEEMAQHIVDFFWKGLGIS
ncbi:TetR/AcrR family transcriptional regulator [Rummeliibacillus pycnus]|uniref:TetR/AcrR family transcriptional regulator n=1 Tax=Rummeliibacillus pycnus TaxID=101070 RepID=UPI001473A7E6|nr:TetR/AcrR family transcriptional regulator [Rummeliibacillus pycnus]